MTKFILFDNHIIVIDDENIVIEIYDTRKLIIKESIGSKKNKFRKYNKCLHLDNHKLFNTWNDLTEYYKIDNCYIIGIYIEYHYNKQIKKKFFHNCFIKEGIYEEYYDNKNLKIVCNYINNKLHGKYEKYSESGYIITSANYNDGLLDGPYKDTIYEFFEKININTFYKNGKIDGEYIKEQHQRLYSVYNYSNNKKNGNFIINCYHCTFRKHLFDSNDHYYHIFGEYDNEILLYVKIYIKYSNELILLQKIYLDNDYKYMIKDYIYGCGDKIYKINIIKNILDYKIYDYIEKFTEVIQFY